MLQSVPTRYSRFVKICKAALGILAFGLLLLIILLPALQTDEKGFRIIFSEENGTHEPQPPRMNNPRFQGSDSDGQPFNISADYALQESPKALMLHKMQGDIMLSSGNWIAVQAGKTLLNMEAGKATLHNKVEVFHDAGYNFRTDNVHIDLKTGHAQSNLPIVMQGPLGTLHATGFILGGETLSITLLGPVRMVIYPPRKE